MSLWTPLGDRAIRFPRPAVSAAALVRAIKAWPGVVDVVVARSEVAVYFEGAAHLDRALAPAAIDELISALSALTDDEAIGRDVELRARYDGPDLVDVARATGLSVDEVIRTHAHATYTVDTIGFAPGFAYLAGLDPVLVIPRRTTPRPRVPAGSLAIAADRCAVYPFVSPGGWHLLGTVDEAMFGPAGARLQLGDRVRFVR